jgi:hypothetical protein
MTDTSSEIPLNFCYINLHLTKDDKTKFIRNAATSQKTTYFEDDNKFTRNIVELLVD